MEYQDILVWIPPDQKVLIIFVSNMYDANIGTFWHRKLYMKIWYSSKPLWILLIFLVWVFGRRLSQYLQYKYYWEVSFEKNPLHLSFIVPNKTKRKKEEELIILKQSFFLSLWWSSLYSYELCYVVLYILAIIQPGCSYEHCSVNEMCRVKAVHTYIQLYLKI